MGLRGNFITKPWFRQFEPAGPAYREQDRLLARTFAAPAEASYLDRIIYLGGQGETGKDLSEHLSSRGQVEEALASVSVCPRRWCSVADATTEREVGD